MGEGSPTDLQLLAVFLSATFTTLSLDCILGWFTASKEEKWSSNFVPSPWLAWFPSLLSYTMSHCQMLKKSMGAEGVAQESANLDV